MVKSLLKILVLLFVILIIYLLFTNIKIVPFSEYKVENQPQVSFSSDGKFLIYPAKKQIVFLSVPNLSLSRTIDSENDYPYFAVWSNDKSYLASSGHNGDIKLWKMPDANLLYTLPGNGSSAVSVHFSQDNKLLAIEELDDIHAKVETRIWIVAEHRLLKTISGSDSVIFSPDGLMIATFENEGRSLKVKDFITDTLIDRFDLDSLVSNFTDFAFSPDSRTIALSIQIDKAHAGLQIWQVKNKQLVYGINDLDDVYDSIAFSPDGKQLACGRADFGDGIETHAKDPSIDIRRVSDGAVVRKLSGHKRDIIEVVYSPDGKYLASSSKDGTIRLWTLS